jgi:YebC/PmpR family DNA-binding regulatory protein
MPKENIERAIKKGTGELEGVEYQESLYEAFAPGGVALMIQTLSDNPTRTVADLRHRLSRNGGNLGATNSVAWMFERKGQIYLSVAAHPNEDQAIEAALEAGATDFQREDDQYVISTDPAELHSVRSALTAKAGGLTPSDAEIAWLPRQTVRVEGKEAEGVIKLIEALEDLDDVQKVDGNFDMDVSAMTA